MIAVPARAAQETADRLMDGGIKVIVNFSPVAIKVKNNVMIRNIDLLGECMLLSTLLTFEENALK